MTGLRDTYTPSTDSPSEQVRDARAHAWAYVFECFHHREGQEGGHATAPEDAKVRSKHDSRADKAIIPE